jgi:hypothetical protein
MRQERLHVFRARVAVVAATAVQCPTPRRVCRPTACSVAPSATSGASATRGSPSPRRRTVRLTRAGAGEFLSCPLSVVRCSSSDVVRNP